MRRLKPCGTYAAYRRHLRRREDVCPQCAQAAARRSREERADHNGHVAHARDRWPVGTRIPRWPARPPRCLACTARLGGDVLLADCHCWDWWIQQREAA